ncbi:hypothetical protein [Streptomyces sp. NPDC002588]|uniref:hypothetical protein n=1 Tax=Streptomyces sp. NPDC002588 TaxID=3154419 RepID=UPI0033231BE0
MDETQRTENGRDKAQSRRLGRFSAALAGAAALVVLSVGVALAAASDEGDGSLPTVSESPSPSPSPSESGDPADSSGGSAGTDGGTIGGTDGGTDPDASETPVESEPSAPADLDELNRRIAELDAKVDQLPTKQELADALRAFADQLDKP